MVSCGLFFCSLLFSLIVSESSMLMHVTLVPSHLHYWIALHRVNMAHVYSVSLLEGFRFWLLQTKPNQNAINNLMHT